MMQTPFDHAVDRLIDQYKLYDQRPERNVVFTHVFPSGITLQVDKRVQGLIESTGRPLWRGTTYVITGPDSKEQRYTYAKLTLKTCTREELSRLESRLFFENVQVDLKIHQFDHGEPIVQWSMGSTLHKMTLHKATLTNGRYFEKIECEEGVVQTNQVRSLSHGSEFSLDSLDWLAQYTPTRFREISHMMNTPSVFSKVYWRTKAFESVINEILDKYEEFDRSPLRDRRLTHTVSHGGIPITVTINKQMLGEFERVGAELYKGSVYRFKEERKEQLYSKITIPHATRSQMEYLETELLRRNIKAVIHLPQVMLLFHEKSHCIYNPSSELWVIKRADGWTLYYAKDLLLAPISKSKNLQTLGWFFRTAPEIEIKPIREKLDHVNAVRFLTSKPTPPPKKHVAGSHVPTYCLKTFDEVFF